MNNQNKTVSEADYNVLKMAESLNAQSICNLALMDSVYGPDYLPRQLAEECSELAQAALKLIRARNGETPDSLTKARNLYIEELADVWVMLDLALMDLTEDEIQYCVDISDYKRDRLKKRLCETMVKRKRDYQRTAEDDARCPKCDECYVEPDQDEEQDDETGDDVWDNLDAAWAALDDALVQLMAEHMEQEELDVAEQQEDVCKRCQHGSKAGGCR